MSPGEPVVENICIFTPKHVVRQLIRHDVSKTELLWLYKETLAILGASETTGGALEEPVVGDICMFTPKHAVRQLFLLPEPVA